MMRFLFGNKRRRRETLITERLDGALDAAGERELAEAIAADPELAGEIAELEAVTALLREQPQQPPPRSFALSASPQPAPVRGTGLLQWTQAAAAAAVLTLVVLTGADIAGLVGTGSPLGESSSEPVVPAAGADAQSAPFADDAGMERFEEASDPAPLMMSEAADEPAARTSPTAPAPSAADGAESAQRSELKADDTESAAQPDEVVGKPPQTVGTETRGASALRRAQWAVGAAAALLVLGAVVLRRRAATRWR